MSAAPAPRSNNESQRPEAVLHVDLDGGREIYRAHGWPHPWEDDLLFESGMRNLLSFLKHNQLRATLFAISANLDEPRKRVLLEQAVREGHEIASHTHTHVDLHKANAREKRHELGHSRDRLQKELDTPVRGFRAPGYTIDREGFELLGELGYAWDSSAFADTRWAALLDVDRAALERPGRPVPGCPVSELPLPGFRPFPFPSSASYALVLGVPWFSLGLARHRSRGGPLVMLLHLTDLAEPLPRDRAASLSQRIFTLSLRSAEAKRRACQAMVERVARHYRWTSTDALYARIAGGAA